MKAKTATQGQQAKLLTLFSKHSLEDVLWHSLVSHKVKLSSSKHHLSYGNDCVAENVCMSCPAILVSLYMQAPSTLTSTFLLGHGCITVSLTSKFVGALQYSKAIGTRSVLHTFTGFRPDLLLASVFPWCDQWSSDLQDSRRWPTAAVCTATILFKKLILTENDRPIYLWV